MTKFLKKITFFKKSHVTFAALNESNSAGLEANMDLRIAKVAEFRFK